MVRVKAKGSHAVLLQLLITRTKNMKAYGHYLEFDTHEFLAVFNYNSKCFYDYLEKLRDEGLIKDLKLSRNHVKLVLADWIPIEMRSHNVPLKGKIKI